MKPADNNASNGNTPYAVVLRGCGDVMPQQKRKNHTIKKLADKNQSSFFNRQIKKRIANF